MSTIFDKHAPGTYKAYRFFDEGWIILFKDEQGKLRLIDGAIVHTFKQAAYRKAAQLNQERKGDIMGKIVAEWITETHTFIERVETRYADFEGNRTRSSGAVHKWDEEGKERLLEAQLAGDTPAEEWDRSKESDRVRTKATSSVVEKAVKER